MKRRAHGIWTWLAMIASGATLFQVYPVTGTGTAGYHGCQRFVTRNVANSLDFCYLLDCQNGFFGGLVDPCNDPSMGPWLLDCGVSVDEEENGDTATEETDTNGTEELEDLL